MWAVCLLGVTVTWAVLLAGGDCYVGSLACWGVTFMWAVLLAGG